MRCYDAQAAIEAFGRAEYDDVIRRSLPHAEAGNPDAQCMISLLYQFGFGVRQDALTAELWLLRAAEQGSALAWNNLGTLYLAGLPGLPADEEKARECYDRARDLGFDRRRE